MRAETLAEAAVPWSRRGDREEKREAVLDAAVASFNERGFHATSLGEVAEALGVTKPTIYHYFADKDAIFFECVSRGLDAIREAAEEAGRAGGSGRDRLEGLAHAYALCMTQPFCMCVTRTSDHELTPESRRRFRALKREIDDVVHGVIRDGMADGSLAHGDARIATATVTGALNWVARWFRPDGALSPEAVAQGCTATLIEGLAPRASREEPAS